MGHFGLMAPPVPAFAGMTCGEALATADELARPCTLAGNLETGRTERAAEAAATKSR
jgi:hypothetical protein